MSHCNGMPREASHELNSRSLTVTSLQHELASFGDDAVRRILREELDHFISGDLPRILRQVLVPNTTNGELHPPTQRDAKPKMSGVSNRTSISSESQFKMVRGEKEEMLLVPRSRMHSLQGVEMSSLHSQQLQMQPNVSQNLFANRHIRTFTAATETETEPDPFRRKEEERPMSKTPTLLESIEKTRSVFSKPAPRRSKRPNSNSVSCPPMVWIAPALDSGHDEDCSDSSLEASNNKREFYSEYTQNSATTLEIQGSEPKVDWVGVSSKIQSRRFSIGSAQSNQVMHLHQLLHGAHVGWHPKLVILVKSPNFDYFTLSLISVNALTIGWQADYMARNKTDLVPYFARAIEICFCAAFTIEVAMRIIAFGRSFFYQRDWRWNWFDCSVVVLQLAEEFVTVIYHSFPMNFSFLRIVRVLRLIRVIRLIRLLRLIGELRTLVTSLSGSLKSFAWTVALLLGMIYTTGIFFTQLVTDHRIGVSLEDNPSTIDKADLEAYFGSLDKAILSLIQSILNGVAWREITNPLQSQIHWMLAFIFCAYVMFCLMAMMNVVTGVFVDCALNSAKKDKEIYMVNSVRSMFQRLDLDLTGQLTWQQFEASLYETEMREYFKQIDVDISEARGVFDLLDMDGSGRLTADEFVSGCMRISGNAKALDVIVLLHELRHVRCTQTRLTTYLENVTLHLQQASNPTLEHLEHKLLPIDTIETIDEAIDTNSKFEA